MVSGVLRARCSLLVRSVNILEPRVYEPALLCVVLSALLMCILVTCHLPFKKEALDIPTPQQTPIPSSIAPSSRASVFSDHSVELLYHLDESITILTLYFSLEVTCMSRYMRLSLGLFLGMMTGHHSLQIHVGCDTGGKCLRKWFILEA